MHVDLFTGKTTEDDTITGATTDADRKAGLGTEAGDVNLTSLDFIFPTLIPGAKINLGWLMGEDSNTQLASDNNKLRTARLGINGGISDNWITYRAEFFQNM